MGQDRQGENSAMSCCNTREVSQEEESAQSGLRPLLRLGDHPEWVSKLSDQGGYGHPFTG